MPIGMYVYSILDDDLAYDRDETFDDANEVINALLQGFRVVVLDAVDLSYQGELELH